MRFPNTTYTEPENARPRRPANGAPITISARPSAFTSPAPATALPAIAPFGGPSGCKLGSGRCAP